MKPHNFNTKALPHFGARRVVSSAGLSTPTSWRLVRAPSGFTLGKERNLEPVKTIFLLALPCLSLVLSGCGSTKSNFYRTTRRGPVWVVPATAAVSATPTSATIAATNSPPKVETNQAPASPATANTPVLRTNTPPVANVLSVADIKDLAGKGVSEQTILNVLRASRAIYTLTTQDVTELQEAKVSRAVTDYLLSTPLLYKDDLLRSRAYYYYSPLYPGYWHWSFHDFHHDVHHYDSHYSYGHDSHHGGLHH